MARCFCPFLKTLHTAPDVVAAAVTVSCFMSAGDAWCATGIGLIDGSGSMCRFAASTAITVVREQPSA